MAGEIELIAKIKPKNDAFVGIVDAAQALVDAVGFTGNLSPSDDTVQKALSTLDAVISGGGSGWTVSSVSANTNAVKDYRYLCNTSAGPFTITLPATPTAGDTISILDAFATFATNNVKVARNGSAIDSDLGDLDLDLDSVEVIFTYTGSTAVGWHINIGGPRSWYV
jgi:hypothetical protein